MKKSPIRKHGKTPAARPVIASRLLLPTLAAVGGGLVAGPAAALELGELELHSTLGQPLRASIAYAVSPNEQIAEYCVSLRAGPAENGLPTLTRARIHIANGVISLSGVTPIREPLMTTRVVVKCPYTPQLSRDYLIFVDPPGTVAKALSENPRTPEAPTIPLAPVAPVPEAPPAIAATPRRELKNTPIQGNSRYRVQLGDSLSMIVQRLENRQVKLWDAIYTIFDANPDAFIDSDPNKLKAGSWLVIPDNAIAHSIATNEHIDVQVVAEHNAHIDVQVVTEHNAGIDAPVVAEYAARIEAPAAAEYAAAQPAADVALSPVIESPVVEAETISKVKPVDEPEPFIAELPQIGESQPDYSTLRPGDIVPGSDRPLVTPEISAGSETIVIPDTRLDESVLSASSMLPVARTTPVVEETSTSNRTSWLIGGAIALFAGLLLFGRKLRDRFGSRPIGTAQRQPSQRRADDEIQEVEAIGDVDYLIGDDSPTHENLILDADLIAGIGLAQKTDMDVNQDFGFAVTTQLDYELPERAALGDEPPATDILPTFRPEIESILDSEVLPEDDDYDMSVIVDVTKIRDIDEITARDLRAVAVESDEEILDIDDYTISQENDYEIVEDKFTEQLSATQELGDEIEKAAAELAVRLIEQEHSKDDEPSSDDSTAMQLGSVSELDVTVSLPAENDVISDLEDTGINEALTIDLPIDDKTVEMPSAGDEQTVEMPMEHGNLDKKTG